VSEATPWLRPSALPKLALCAQYRSDPVSGPAAERGTRIDEAFRRVLAHENVSLEGWPDEDKTALRWAVDTIRALAGEHAITSAEEELRVEAMGMTGTMDAAVCQLDFHVDLKTGQFRNYVEQQALYSVACMDSLLCDEWTAYLLYCDQESVERLHFTRAEAEGIVRKVLAKVRDNEPPEANDYCGWCANRFTCPARREALGLVPFDGASTLTVKDATSEQLATFVRRARVVEDFAEEARGELKERLIKGEKVPGVSLTSRKGARVINKGWLPDDPAILLALLPAHISEDKLRAVWPDDSFYVFPGDKAEQMPGSTYVTVRKAKAT
jgi:hypothetical protein